MSGCSAAGAASARGARFGSPGMERGQALETGNGQKNPWGLPHREKAPTSPPNSLHIYQRVRELWGPDFLRVTNPNGERTVWNFPLRFFTHVCFDYWVKAI